MVLPIVFVILAIAVLALVIFGMSDWFELMFLAAVAALIFGMYKGTI